MQCPRQSGSSGFMPSDEHCHQIVTQLLVGDVLWAWREGGRAGREREGEAGRGREGDLEGKREEEARRGRGEACLPPGLHQEAQQGIVALLWLLVLLGGDLLNTLLHQPGQKAEHTLAEGASRGSALGPRDDFPPTYQTENPHKKICDIKPPAAGCMMILTFRHFRILWTPIFQWTRIKTFCGPQTFVGYQILI